MVFRTETFGAKINFLEFFSYQFHIINSIKPSKRQITLAISSWNHPQLAEIIKCLPDEAVDRIGEIFYTGKFRTKTGAPCKVETVVLSDSRRLGVEFRPYDNQNKKGLTVIFRRISQNECNTNQQGLKAHFNGRGRPY